MPRLARAAWPMTGDVPVSAAGDHAVPSRLLTAHPDETVATAVGSLAEIEEGRLVGMLPDGPART